MAAVAATAAEEAAIVATIMAIKIRIKTRLAKVRAKKNKRYSTYYHGCLDVIHNEMFVSKLEISMDRFR